MSKKLIGGFGGLLIVFAVTAADFGGVGISLIDRRSPNEPLRTGSIVPSSPAERAGIQPGWLLISINGTNAVNMSLPQAASLVRGPVGTSVTLELADPGMSGTNKFMAKRGKMVISEDKLKIVEE
jgi:C-terminal processing protease CtpA/Prc